jgi:hypothetical protein
MNCIRARVEVLRDCFHGRGEVLRDCFPFGGKDLQASFSSCFSLVGKPVIFGK